MKAIYERIILAMSDDICGTAINAKFHNGVIFRFTCRKPKDHDGFCSDEVPHIEACVPGKSGHVPQDLLRMKFAALMWPFGEKQKP